MTCSEFIEGFSAYYDGVADPESQRRADEHLEGCESCSRYLEVFDRGRTLLRSFPEVEVSDDFEPRLKHRLYHLDDADALGEPAAALGRHGSATTAATTVGMALLLVLAAWSPALLDRDPQVDLPEIVVSTPETRPLGLRPPAVTLSSAGPTHRLSGTDADLWRQSNALLFEHSPLSRRPAAASFRQTGLD